MRWPSSGDLKAIAHHGTDNEVNRSSSGDVCFKQPLDVARMRLAKAEGSIQLGVARHGVSRRWLLGRLCGSGCLGFA